MKTISVLVGAAIFVGGVFCGMLLAAAIIETGAHVEAQDDPDEEICEGVARRMTTGSPSSSLDFSKLRADIYQKCVARRDERRRYERDALDAEYLERLQACEQRYEEIYGAWMACAEPDVVEGEDDAGRPAAR